MSEPRRKASRLTRILAGLLVAALATLVAVPLVRGFRQARIIDEIRHAGDG